MLYAPGIGKGVVIRYPDEWLTALRVPALRGAKLISLIDHFGGISGVSSAPDSSLRDAGLKPAVIEALRKPDPDLLRSDREWLSGDGHHLVTWDDERYPPLLRDIPDPPAALYIDGDPDALWQAQLAVIGSRNPTSGGRRNARDFAAELARQGLTITSGMADGIDSEAHEAALSVGKQTVAVLGTGVDRVYPAKGAGLASRVAAAGALVSEFPPGTGPHKSHFPSRNRIISGLGLGVLVIEAGLRSGTLITARLAGEQGREVFALPGSIHNPMSKGCHRLIREGAKLVEDISQIMQELGPLAGELAAGLRSELDRARNVRSKDGLAGGGRDPNLEGERVGEDAPPWETDEEYRRLWACIGYDPCPVDTIIEKSGLTARAVSAMLLMLELRGMVEAHPGGAYCRIK